MRGHPDEISEALTALASRLAAQLSATGWNSRFLDDYNVATLTRSLPSGVIAVVELERASFQWPDDWPVEVEALLGVGYEPALNLMPLLTLHPRAILVDETEPGRVNRLTVSLDGLETIDVVVDRIVRFVAEHASATTRDFAAPEDIDVHLQQAVRAIRESQDDAREDIDDDARALDAQLRLVLLTAMGKYDAARTSLAAYVADYSKKPPDRADGRFIRQLTRWLDAGGTAAPPVEETLAQLTRRPRPTRPSWANAQAKSRANRAALDAARAQSKGKTLTELKDLLATEYSTRGIDVAPSTVDFNAQMLEIEQLPFGRARSALKAIRMLAAGGRDAVHLLKQTSADDPEWLQPPRRAAYPVRADRNRYASIELDPAAGDWLERVRTEAPRRIGSWAFVQVWLTQEVTSDSLVAHVADRRVGTVDPSTRAEFEKVMRAAAVFDEDPVVRGRISAPSSVEKPSLEIPLPER